MDLQESQRDAHEVLEALAPLRKRDTVLKVVMGVTSLLLLCVLTSLWFGGLGNAWAAVGRVRGRRDVPTEHQLASTEHELPTLPEAPEDPTSSVVMVSKEEEGKGEETEVQQTPEKRHQKAEGRDKAETPSELLPDPLVLSLAASVLACHIHAHMNALMMQSHSCSYSHT
jgi:hypothetical protein